MCLIIAKMDAESVVPVEHIRSAFTNNSDGFGIMTARDGRIVVSRGLYGINQIEALFADHAGVPFVAHYRFATSGGVSVANTHPFKILDKDEDGMDLYMVHNGVITRVNSTATESDTAVFVKQMLIPLFKSDPTLIQKPEFQELLKNAIGGGNKLTFMDGDGKITIINDSAGHRQGEIWYSNKYSLESLYRANRQSTGNVANTFSGAFYPKIDEVVRNSAAERAGFHIEDVIVRVNNIEIKNFDQVMAIIAGSKGHPCKFEMYRAIKSKYVQITCKARPYDAEDGSTKYLLGLASKGLGFAPSKKVPGGVGTNNVIKSARDSAAVFSAHMPTADGNIENRVHVHNKAYPDYCYSDDGVLNIPAADEYDRLKKSKKSTPIDIDLTGISLDEEEGSGPVLEQMTAELLTVLPDPTIVNDETNLDDENERYAG
jgi:hypothetical protein